ncbi:Ti-type conjugative transfer relaxase TraA [Rhizobium sp. R693]|uniref:Ti-type conjugative transfer relaxase TraA n=1 Tax=Rhizobium sp. R693 TaxID=1764276 RepID=UPI000B534A9D|nr:Ti-type conjugative transfer relaxase TraA [Rhizobium sp. R693]OWV96145.1 conjugal transfer protein TraA [Rhizobium sp. R693]
MAIYHASMKPVSRSSGRSAVAAAAYRAGVRLTNKRDGITHDFTNKQGVAHAEIVLPVGVDAMWARDRSALWNAAERAEKRSDARVAREFEIALPHELTIGQRLALTRAFAQDLADRYGAAVDVAIHRPHEQSDVRNHHAHLLMTTRQVREEGLGAKTYIERENKWLLSNDLPTSHMQLGDIRLAFEQHANRHLAMAGLDIRIDHRSHQEHGLEIEPTEHMGVHATQLERQGMAVSRARLDAAAARRNADLIREKPEQVLTLITNEKSVFDRHDVARTLHRYINDDIQAFQNAFASVMASPALVELQPERIDEGTGEIELARYSTREIVALESAMARRARVLGETRGHGVDRRHVDRAIARQNAAIRSSLAASVSPGMERDGKDGDAKRMEAGLSEQQRRAIEHITGAERIAVVVGFAGAGKSTMLAAARQAWEAQGYRVHGAALSGKAAEGLEESSGIASRTLASWDYGWQAERNQLHRGDVLVIDEAGMIGSRQLARFIGEVEARGAKIVLVGDHEQLQAIGAGAPFRAIAEQIGHVELSEIRRQREDWQRVASVAFATHRTAEGLAAYRKYGDIRFSDTKDDALAEVVGDYLADRNRWPEGTRVAMAHRRADVRAINARIRSTLQERGELARGAVESQELGREISYSTNDGKRSFAPGDRIAFLENNRDLGVRNGMLGTVESVETGQIVARLDGRGDHIVVPTADYRAIDHGYATTIHKNQGATVDRAYVLASRTMDRHLTYVAMTRHRDGVHLYADRQEFVDRNAGRLLAHGKAPYQNNPGNRDSYYVTLETEAGRKHTVWGVDLERAIAKLRPAIGDTIGLEHVGSQTVRLPDGSTATRNAWKVHGVEALAYRQLEDRLSRSGVKETTLDYTRNFAERRGIAARFGAESEIDLAPAAKAGPVQKDAAHSMQERTERAVTQRRGMFDGLKLKPAQEASPEVPERSERAESLQPSGFERAVNRYARAFEAAHRNQQAGLPMLEAQRQELRQAGLGLDQARAGSHQLMRSALQHDPEVQNAMTERSGRARVGELIAGMKREGAALADPDIRADRFVARWQELRGEHQALSGRQHDEARQKIENEMRGMAKSLERDPQVESILQNRTQDLGIRRERQNESLARDIDRSLSERRDLGLER